MGLWQPTYFIISIAFEKTATLKFLPYMDNRPAGQTDGRPFSLPLIITRTHIFHVNQKTYSDNCVLLNSNKDAKLDHLLVILHLIWFKLQQLLDVKFFIFGIRNHAITKLIKKKENSFWSTFRIEYTLHFPTWTFKESISLKQIPKTTWQLNFLCSNHSVLNKIVWKK